MEARSDLDRLPIFILVHLTQLAGQTILAFQRSVGLRPVDLGDQGHRPGVSRIRLVGVPGFDGRHLCAVLSVDVGGSVALLASKAKQLLVVATSRLANHTKTIQPVPLGVAGQLAELLFNLVSSTIDRDGNLPVRGSHAGVDRVSVQLFFADVEADHQFVVGVYSAG